MSSRQAPAARPTGGHGGGPGGGGPGRHGFQKPKNTKRTLLRLLSYLGRYKYLLIPVLLLMLVSTVASSVGTFLISDVIDNGIAPYIGKNALPWNPAPLLQALAVLVVLYVCGAAASYGYSRLMITVSTGILNVIRQDLFAHMQTLPLRFFDAHTHGELMSRFTSDVDTLRECISQSILQLLSGTVTFLITLGLMVYISPLLTLTVFGMLLIMLLVVKTIGGKSATYFRRQQAAVGAVNGYIEEHIEGQKVVKVFNREEPTKQAFAGLNDQLRKAATNANTYASIIMPIMGNLGYLNYALCASLGAYMLLTGTGAFTIGSVTFGALTIGTLVSYLQYSREFSRPISQMSQQVNVVLAALAGAERIFTILDTPPEVDDGDISLVNATVEADDTLREAAGKTGTWAWKQADGRLTKWEGEVRFDDVTFSYDGEKTVLNNVSLYAHPGQKIAFVGSTGAGKTTITNLINRFYDVQEGTITFDGINVKQIKKDTLRHSMAMVLQDTHLFTGTVKENIAYGRLDATDAEIVAAAKLANAHSFIKRLPQGYDTPLTGDGGNLSQGQRQLLAIARAAIADPPVLILDEATSSIDTRTEALIERGMDELMRGRTVFVIAHRLSTVRNADAILVLEHGEIIERGTHDDLLAKQGRYYQLYTGRVELD